MAGMLCAGCTGITKLSYQRRSFVAEDWEGFIRLKSLKTRAKHYYIKEMSCLTETELGQTAAEIKSREKGKEDAEHNLKEDL
jgi:hypothetical protein